MAKAKRTLPVATERYTPSPSEKAERRRYEVEDAMRTIQRAKELEKDKAMMKEVKSMAKEKIAEMKKIC